MQSYTSQARYFLPLDVVFEIIGVRNHFHQLQYIFANRLVGNLTKSRRRKYGCLVFFRAKVKYEVCICDCNYPSGPHRRACVGQK